MALQVVTHSGTSSSRNYLWKQEIIEESINRDTNTSLVIVKTYIGFSSTISPNNAWFGGNADYSITCDNQNSSDNVYYYRTGSPGSWVETYSASFEVEHEADGDKTIYVSSAMSTTEFVPNSAVVGGNIKLTKIPRATTAPAVSGYVKSSYSIPLNPSFSHSIKILFGSISTWVQADGTLGVNEYRIPANNNSYLFTIPAEFYDMFDGPYGQGKIYIYTYEDTTLIDVAQENTITIQCNPLLCTPVVTSVSVKDINPITTELTNDANNIVKHVSQVAITPTIKLSDNDDNNVQLEYKLINNVAFTDSTAIVNNPTQLSFTLEIKNSRGMTSKTLVSASGELINYVPITLNASVARVEPTTGEVELTYSGNFYEGFFDEDETNANELKLSWAYREKGSTVWTEGGTKPLAIGDSPTSLVMRIPDNYFEYMVEQYELAGESLVDVLAETDTTMIESQIVYNETSDYYFCTVTIKPKGDGTGLSIYQARGTLDDYRVYYNSSITDFNGLSVEFGTLTLVDTESVLYNYILQPAPIALTGYRIGNNKYSGTESLGTIFDYKKQYEFLIYYEDSVVVGTPMGLKVSRGLPVYWWDEKTFHIIDSLEVNGGQVFGEKTIWQGNVVLSGTIGVTTSVDSMPKLLDYTGHNVRFYVRVGNDATQVFEYNLTDGQTTMFTLGIFHFSGTYATNANQSNWGVYQIIDTNSTTWRTHVLGQYATDEYGGMAQSNPSVSISLIKITIL